MGFQACLPAKGGARLESREGQVFKETFTVEFRQVSAAMLLVGGLLAWVFSGSLATNFLLGMIAFLLAAKLASDV